MVTPVLDDLDEVRISVARVTGDKGVSPTVIPEHRQSMFNVVDGNLQDSDLSLDTGSFLPIDVAERPKAAASRGSFREQQAQLAPPTACVFSSVLGETHNRTSGFKELFRRLEPLFPDRRKIEAKLRDGAGGFSTISKALASDSGTALLVIGNPTKPLSPSEQQKLVDFVVDGGHLIVAAGEGGFQGSNINDVLQLFGITARADAVLRCMLHKYYHPKEAIIPDGVVNRALTQGSVDSIAGTLPTIALHHLHVHYHHFHVSESGAGSSQVQKGEKHRNGEARTHHSSALQSLCTPMAAH